MLYTSQSNDLMSRFIATRIGTSASGRERDVQVSKIPISSFQGITCLRFPDCDKISPPLLQLSGGTFGYNVDVPVLKNVDIDVGLDSRIAIVGANGAGKYAKAFWFLLVLS